MKYTEIFCNAELRTAERGSWSVAVQDLMSALQRAVPR